MYYTYVLKSLKDGRWYTGQSSDLRARVEEHNKGRVESTRQRRPMRLIYYEACLAEDDAKRREHYLKSGKGKLYVRKRLATWLDMSQDQLERH
jgi:putative endonuclease